MKKAQDFIGSRAKVIMDRPLGTKHPKYDYIYPVNYGYIPNTLAPDGKEIDVYILGLNEPVKTFEGLCVAVIHRVDDNDDKCIVVPEEKKDITDEEIRKLTHFQEQWFTSEILR